MCDTPRSGSAAAAAPLATESNEDRACSEQSGCGLSGRCCDAARASSGAPVLGRRAAAARGAAARRDDAAGGLIDAECCCKRRPTRFALGLRRCTRWAGERTDFGELVDAGEGFSFIRRQSHGELVDELVRARVEACVRPREAPRLHGADFLKREIDDARRMNAVDGTADHDARAIGGKGKAQQVAGGAEDFGEGLRAIVADEEPIGIGSAETNVDSIGVCRVNPGDVRDVFGIRGVEEGSRPRFASIIRSFDGRCVHLSDDSADVDAIGIGRSNVDGERDHVARDGRACLCPRDAVVVRFRQNDVEARAHAGGRDGDGARRFVTMNRHIDDVFAFEWRARECPRAASIVRDAETFEDAGENAAIGEHTDGWILRAAVTDGAFANPAPRASCVGAVEDAVGGA